MTGFVINHLRAFSGTGDSFSRKPSWPRRQDQVLPLGSQIPVPDYPRLSLEMDLSLTLNCEPWEARSVAVMVTSGPWSCSAQGWTQTRCWKKVVE